MPGIDGMRPPHFPCEHLDAPATFPLDFRSFCHELHFFTQSRVSGSRDFANMLSSRIAETPLKEYPNKLGFSPIFNFSAPDDILRDEFEISP